MDAHGLLLELQEEMNQLCDKKYTHLGIGFASNDVKVLIVEILSSRGLAVDRLNHSEDGGIEVAGRLFHASADVKSGLYAARISLLSNPKKTYTEAAPEHMVVMESKEVKNERQFIINMKPPSEEVFNCPDPKFLELLVRGRGDALKIKYGGDA